MKEFATCAIPQLARLALAYDFSNRDDTLTKGSERCT